MWAVYKGCFIFVVPLGDSSSAETVYTTFNYMFVCLFVYISYMTLFIIRVGLYHYNLPHDFIFIYVLFFWMHCNNSI